MPEIEVSIDGVIVNHIYSGYVERVTYAGMPSDDSFSILYETFYVRDNPDSRLIISHDPANFINIPERSRQLFYPVGYEGTIKFGSRTKIEFQVKSVTPTSLTAIINDE